MLTRHLKTFLEEFMARRNAEEGVICMAGDQASKFDYQILKTGIPSCHRVLTTGQDTEEVLFRLQGVLMDVNLGPLKECLQSPRPLSKKFGGKELIHSIELSGLGSKVFDQGIMNLYLWDLRLSRMFEAAYWNQWTPESGKEDATLLFTNRVLTPSFLCEGAEELPLPSTLGKHAQALVQEGSHKYILDNEIALYEHVKTADQDKYIQVPYTTFRKGDIVEASFSLIILPTNSGKRCTKLVLRGLSLESAAYTNILQAMMIRKAMEAVDMKKRKRSNSDEGKPKQKVNFRRAKCYKEEDVEKEVEVTDEKLQRMDITGDH
ncbi:hypothetical protein SCHPADRAFT_896326 [Schizopora paradoxa]|uniref:Uncharacterized protein n=1 Tax=Schizopora paradoxa TaxID=27342 RepID=A0A0H2R7A9_9AGAM|nr:hypothetical protein SCHPADRAFT_896326 [Schizopora paradoxa]